MNASASTASEPVPIFDNAAGSVWFVPSGAYVRLNWSSDPVPSEVWRQLLEQVLVPLEGQSWSKLLGDQRMMPVFATENQAWILIDWLPRAVRAGLHYGAIVAPQNVMTRLETAALLREFNTYPLLYRIFADEAVAINWLMQQP